ncbi:hypothetical protein RVF83_09800 [Gordonia rubripertincta]|uniref:MAPEG family protein n=2 Tax=Gordonia rubripertincta TaxID=36822 RepID=A0AAW6RDE4_GORRU|nr:hypothetical protein [Gordonia rubripertincta]MBM7277903.1 hypothetical protein [Gordonia rubripertincta]MDG6781264.1 hypothetical protein [Gordonia rubripertincta]NKY62253.1 hypothetical protein [Gordonia rubripertincta]QMU22637.1 hypothetical protein H3V45_09275 [Gordonia rubripertincta]GAB83603.1 hypothetical protein GORBP_012_01160 [Gordonia rubripertincta NBRC 101908]
MNARPWTVLHGPLFSRSNPLDREHAAPRISAYIYGNILILAALIPLHLTDDFVGVLIVLGTAASTFVAHVFAEAVGRRVHEGPVHPTKTMVLRNLRDSVPILSSASVPCLILAAAWMGWIDPRTAQIAAEIVILLRIGGTVFVIDRLNNERPSRATLIGAAAVTVVATVIVVIKIVLTH